MVNNQNGILRFVEVTDVRIITVTGKRQKRYFKYQLTVKDKFDRVFIVTDGLFCAGNVFPFIFNPTFAQRKHYAFQNFLSFLGIDNVNNLKGATIAVTNDQNGFLVALSALAL